MTDVVVIMTSCTLYSGDLSYADGYLGQWEDYFDMMQVGVFHVRYLSEMHCFKIVCLLF